MTIKQIALSAFIIGSITNNAIAINKTTMPIAFEMNLNSNKFRDSIPFNPSEFDRISLASYSYEGKLRLSSSTLKGFDRVITNDTSFVDALLCLLLNSVREDGRKDKENLMSIPCVYCPLNIVAGLDGLIILGRGNLDICKQLQQELGVTNAQ